MTELDAIYINRIIERAAYLVSASANPHTAFASAVSTIKEYANEKDENEQERMNHHEYQGAVDRLREAVGI